MSTRDTHNDSHSGKNSVRSSLNSVQWFGDFVQGNVSPTDIVLSRVERRLLPPLASQNCAATPDSPIWVHTNASVTAIITSHQNLFGIEGNSLTSWFRTDPSLYGYTSMNRLGLGIEWNRRPPPGAHDQRRRSSSSSSSSPHQQNHNHPFSASALRAAVFGELCSAQLQCWTTGATFTLPNFPFVQQVAVQSSSRNFGMAYLRGEFRRPTVADVVSWLLVPVVLVRSATLWLLFLLVGERPLSVPSVVLSSGNDESVLRTDGKVERLSASESIARAKQQKQLQQQSSSSSSSSSSSLEKGTESSSSRGNRAPSNSASSNAESAPEPVIVTWHASASYQKDPFFVMLRLNAALPVSPTTELSLYADPLRRCHVALCTQLIRNRVDAGMRLRLNTISWKDAALDVGVLCNVGSVASDGRPLCIGAQYTGNALQLFADITEGTTKPGQVKQGAGASSTSAASWFDASSNVVKSLRCGVIVSKFPSARNGDQGSNRSRFGTDFFFRVRF